MGTTMDRWYSACSKRCSVREYNNAAFSLQQLADIKELISELSCDEARLVLLKDGEALKAPFFSPQLVGARYSVAVVASQNYEYVAGSIGEAFVLECASMDIGTCWLAKFNKRYVSSHVSLKGSERVLCLIAFGYTDIPLKCKKKGKRSPIEITGYPMWIMQGCVCGNKKQQSVPRSLRQPATSRNLNWNSQTTAYPFI